MEEKNKIMNYSIHMAHLAAHTYSMNKEQKATFLDSLIVGCISGSSKDLFVQKIIDENYKYIETKRLAARKGGLARATSSAKQTLSSAKQTLSSAKQTLSNGNVNVNVNEHVLKDLKEKEEKEKTPRKRKYAFTFNYETKAYEGITLEWVNLMKEAYPNINHNQEAKNSIVWLINNKHKRKEDFPKFLSNWYKRASEPYTNTDTNTKIKGKQQ